MNLPADKILHLKGGAAAAAAMLGVAQLAAHVGPWAGVAAGSLAIAVGVEVYQKVRREGTPDWRDALASAIPGLSLAAAMYLSGWPPA